MAQLPDDAAHAYLELLGVAARPGAVDVETLTALQRAHLARVPYDTIDVYRGRAPGIDTSASVARIVAGRGGYCFHLNGAFSVLLDWLGVDVTRHLAGVQGRGVPVAPGANGNHLALTVSGLGSPEPLLVDVGLGDGPGDPIPLRAGVAEQGTFRYTLSTSDAVPGGWRFDHDACGWFVGFDALITERSVPMSAFAPNHRDLSTLATSGFTRIPTVQRRVGDAVEALRGCVLSVVRDATVESVDVETSSEWWALVIDRFGLAYDDLTAAERAEVWDRTRSTHLEWVAAGRV